MSEERNSNDVEDKISIKEIHETFWRCRDFELSHLWQRSIFAEFNLQMQQNSD